MQSVPEVRAQLGPRTRVARDSALIERVVDAARAVDAAEAALLDTVRASVTAGDSWAVIGTALGISRQAAQQRFGKDWTPPPRRRAPEPPDSLRVGPFDRGEALRRQREGVAALLENPEEMARLFGDGLDDELDDGFAG